MHPAILSAETEMFAMSDAVMFSARWLMEQKRTLHPELQFKSATIRNAVQPEDFDFMSRRQETRRKTIGYAGSLDFWFDVDTVRFAAQRHPEWDFVMFGRVEGNEIQQLRELPNVRLMGEVTYPSLRKHFASVDACIIPFRLSPLTLATNPLKLYEYFACGHPVVSSPLPEVLEFGDLVYVAREPKEFLAQLEAAIAENDPLLRPRRRRLAEQETWIARGKALEGHFHSEAPSTSQMIDAPHALAG